jgi:hypothetical protein
VGTGPASPTLECPHDILLLLMVPGMLYWLQACSTTILNGEFLRC